MKLSETFVRFEIRNNNDERIDICDSSEQVNERLERLLYSGEYEGRVAIVKITEGREYFYKYIIDNEIGEA